MERSWTRGVASARIVSPAEHALTIAAAGWSPSTPGAVRAGGVLRCEEEERFREISRKVEGRDCHLSGAGRAFRRRSRRIRNAEFRRPMQQPPPRIGEPPMADPYEAFLKAAKERTEFLKEEGVAAVLRDSNKPHGLLNMTDVSLARYDIGLIPTAFITGEGYRMIFRMLKRCRCEWKWR